MSVKVKCENEKCKKLFNVHIKVGPEIYGKFEVYFICPYCQKHYTGYFENRQTLSIQEQINELNHLVQNTRMIKKNMNFQKEFNNRQKYLSQITKLKENKKRLLEKINRKNKSKK